MRCIIRVASSLRVSEGGGGRCVSSYFAGSEMCLLCVSSPFISLCVEYLLHGARWPENECQPPPATYPCQVVSCNAMLNHKGIEKVSAQFFGVLSVHCAQGAWRITFSSSSFLRCGCLFSSSSFFRFGWSVWRCAQRLHSGFVITFLIVLVTVWVCVFLCAAPSGFVITFSSCSLAVLSVPCAQRPSCIAGPARLLIAQRAALDAPWQFTVPGGRTDPK